MDPNGPNMALSMMPLLLGALLLVLLLVLPIVVGNRAPYVRKHLWGALGLFIASGVIPFAMSVIIGASMVSDPPTMPSDDELNRLVNLTSIGSAVGAVLRAGALVLYFLAAVRVAREVERSRRQPAI